MGNPRTVNDRSTKHDVPMCNEAEPMDHMSNFFQAGFGLKPDEPW